LPQGSDRQKNQSFVERLFWSTILRIGLPKKPWRLLLQLANEVGLKDAIHKQFNGEINNNTEGREVLHTAPKAKESEYNKSSRE